MARNNSFVFSAWLAITESSVAIFPQLQNHWQNLLRKRNKFIWSERCQQSLDKLKAVLISVPVLKAPNFNCRFKLAVDASDTGAGSVLLQEDENGVDHPVCYFSTEFNASQMNYSTIEKECLSLILAVQHFEVYLTLSSLPIIVYSDHNPLTFINKMKNNNQRCGGA